MDTSPSPTDHAYVVTAVDWVGNESEPSASAYLNFALLPVATLEVVQEDDNQPVLSWSHSGGVAGYDLYLEQGAVKVNQDLLLETSSAMTSWGGLQRLTGRIPLKRNSPMMPTAI